MFDVKIELVRRLAAEATQQCIREFEKIQQGLPPCFRINPGRRLTKKRCGELLKIIEWEEERRKHVLDRLFAS